jgi:hypothetical protein
VEGCPVTRAKNRSGNLANTVEQKLIMTIDGEDTFEVYRFGWDSAGLIRPGGHFGLQSVCNLIEERKKMIFTKRPDLSTIR